ncbi:MAG: pyruvate dehydrogenase (acetyl-transferring) E1 component subunit alpha [Chloroflexota bacterium]
MTTSTEPEQALALPNAEASYALMLRIRRFEERCYELFMQNHIHGTMHLGIGQEAIAAGAAAALRSDDYSLATYRGHAHVLARGADLTASFAEMFGRATGLCKGKGGSMHLTSVEHGQLGTYAIIGAHLPIACGSAWSAKLRGTDQVTVCFFGDGTTNIGAFHEALNLAAVWKLPAVFVCENNFYMEYTPIASVTAVPRPAADRASAYGLSPITVDGNNLEAVYAEVQAAVDRARAGEGPSLIEALTYRHHGHSRTDPAKYRPQGELEEWKGRDPIMAFRARMQQNGWSEERLQDLEQGVDRDIQEASDRALAAPYPDEGELFTDVYCGSDTRWRN